MGNEGGSDTLDPDQSWEALFCQPPQRRMVVLASQAEEPFRMPYHRDVRNWGEEVNLPTWVVNPRAHRLHPCGRFLRREQDEFRRVQLGPHGAVISSHNLSF